MVDAPPGRAWEAVVATAPPSGAGAGLFATVLGCREREQRGDPAASGSTVIGFRVAHATPPAELALEGEHRFSRYALTFRIDDLGDGRSRVRAETRADFPGLHGRAYRALVIGTRLHVVAVRRVLGAVQARAQTRPPASMVDS